VAQRRPAHGRDVCRGPGHQQQDLTHNNHYVYSQASDCLATSFLTIEQGIDTAKITHKVELINSEINQLDAVAKRYESQLAQLDRAINQQLDANRSAQELNFRKQQEVERKEIRAKLDQLQASLQELVKQKTELKSQTTLLDSKLGALKYVAELFVDAAQVDVEKTVRWMIIAIVIVFDPLAVLMLIAAAMNGDKLIKSSQNLQMQTPDIFKPSQQEPKIITFDVKSPDKPMAWHNMQGNFLIETHQGWKNLNTIQPNSAWTGDKTATDSQNIKEQTHGVMTNQVVDLSEIQKHMEEFLDKLLDKNVNVVQPPDISLVKEMVQEIIGNPKQDPDKKPHQ